MKKYWILIVISVVMIASIGTFYIQSVFAANNKPMFAIEKVHGDVKEINSLLLEGYYYNELTFVGEEFEIGSEGTRYLADSSFFDRVDGMYGSPRIKQLQKDYRNFMRGKYNVRNSYFENEEFLAYADVSYKNPYTISSELQFMIAVLDKQTDKTISFEHLVPNSSDFWYLDVEKVQVIGDQLKVITLNDMREGERQEIHLYTFDLEKMTLLNDEIILPVESNVDEYIDVRALSVDDPTGECEHLIFVKTNTKFTEERIMEEVLGEELIVSDIMKNKVKVINLESLSEYGYPEYFDGSNVFFTDIDENGVLKVTTYDIENEQIVDDFVVELSNNAGLKYRSFNNGKLYLVDSHVNFETPAFLSVVSLENGETLFEGEFIAKDQKSKADKLGLDIYNISFE